MTPFYANIIDDQSNTNQYPIMRKPLEEARCTTASVEIPAGFCAKLADSLVALKKQLIAKYEDALPGRRHVVRKVIGEAEALAWATPFPHLFLPDYAELRFAAALAVEEPALAQAA
jgi:hypothetical protein